MTSPDASDQTGILLDLHVLGPLAVLRKGERVALPPSRKTRALLAYLAVAGHPQRRERLCTMFWNTPDDPRGALRWSLSKIRQIVNIDGQDLLTADRNEVALRSQSIGLDLRQVRAIPQHHLPSLDISRLEDMAGLFKGGIPRGPVASALSRVRGLARLDDQRNRSGQGDRPARPDRPACGRTVARLALCVCAAGDGSREQRRGERGQGLGGCGTRASREGSAGHAPPRGAAMRGR